MASWMFWEWFLLLALSAMVLLCAVAAWRILRAAPATPPLRERGRLGQVASSLVSLLRGWTLLIVGAALGYQFVDPNSAYGIYAPYFWHSIRSLLLIVIGLLLAVWGIYLGWSVWSAGRELQRTGNLPRTWLVGSQPEMVSVVIGLAVFLGAMPALSVLDAPLPDSQADHFDEMSFIWEETFNLVEQDEICDYWVRDSMGLTEQFLDGDDYTIEERATFLGVVCEGEGLGS